MLTSSRFLDPTPPRPPGPIAEPNGVRTFDVEVDVAHLANPVLAVQRLLATDMGAYGRVVGDETRFTIQLVVPDTAKPADTEAWINWIVHHAGVRGTITAR